MIKIDGEITIPAPYHIVSVLFEVDQIKRVNPKINKIETLFETPDRVGSRYLQYYDEHRGDICV
ncbi:hypothetical protein [Macrococcus carouselicus]|uniref:Uncharacterized protein n=1 Tax=Macrococcus carouselicus TaxID=69969 RepID=A0A9Q8FM70_9STAP|nr:hypothetical protein [Macrococcus carouselicus]TDM02491.1 hypothetical protein ERX40_08015 [Macrococcus carouselicus]